MNGAWRDGYPGIPAHGAPQYDPQTGYPEPRPGGPIGGIGYSQGYDPMADPRTFGAGYQANDPAASVPGPRRSLPDVLTSKVSRVRQFEGLRGYSTRSAIAIKHLAYFLLITLVSGVTEAATQGVKYASGGGKFMFVACSTIAFTGAVSTLFYVNLRQELVEKVRHYVFGIILIPGMLLSLLLRALQEWEWANEGSLGTTLQAALPAVFLATVVLPTLVFVKEMLGIRTLHRSKLDDQEAVHLWTRQDGLQR